MIGGRDTIIPTRDSLVALEVAMRAVSRLWPRVVLEDGVTGERLHTYGDIRLAGRREILAFKDAAASAMWSEIGAAEATNGTLIHLLIAPGELTVVVDDEPSSEMRKFVASLQRSLAQEMFASYLPEAA